MKNVSLIAVATTAVEETVEALEYSLNNVIFEKVQLLAHYNPKSNSKDYEYIQIDSFSNVREWGRFIVFDLYKYVTTKHILLIHADGFIVNTESWDDDFLKYDYIGAPWPLPKDNYSFRDHFGNIVRVGNSVSIRSFDILKFPSEKNIKWEDIDGFYHEDGFLCVKIRHKLVSNGFKFAPLEIACKFSHEKMISEIKGIRPFVFHKWEGGNRDYPRFGRYKMNFIKKIIRKLRKFCGKSN